MSEILTRAEADQVWVGDLGDYAGSSLAVGDFDGSGKNDLAIGAPWRDAPDNAATAVPARSRSRSRSTPTRGAELLVPPPG